MRGSKSHLTAGEAAKHLGVAPATIQRWVNRGLLHAERTLGGHRRIPVTEVRRLTAAGGPLDERSSVARWIDTLMAARAIEMRMALLAARQRCGSWAATADEVASAVAEIGRRWELGLCAVFEEHRASEALRRATAACAEEIPREKGASQAVLFTVEGERHTLGLSLAELVLAEAGWSVTWLGEGPPAEELPSVVRMQKPDLLIVSASAGCKPQAVATYQRALISVTAGTRIEIVAGGAGFWPPDRRVSRAVTFEDLQRIIERRKPTSLARRT